MLSGAGRAFLSLNFNLFLDPKVPILITRIIHWHARSSNLAHLNVSFRCSNAKQLNTSAKEATTQQQNNRTIESISKSHIDKHKCNYDRDDDSIGQDDATTRKANKFNQGERELQSTQGWNHGEERDRAQRQRAQKIYCPSSSTEGC